jgi:serine/threonine protein kinase
VALNETKEVVIGRYALFEEMASGGMATVHYGRLVGPEGFSRTVAIKRLHPTFSKDPDFRSMFYDEARIAARVRHPNVVATLDVVAHGDEVLLVMEYVQGVSLSQAFRALRATGARVPVPIAVAVIVQVLFGLHAAHEAKGEGGVSLDIVHRDVSPQNVLIGVDGIARIADFGIAKAVGRLQTTAEGIVKGKTAYMAPEQMRGRGVDRRTDVYAAGVVLWEALTAERLFGGETQPEVMNAVLEKVVPPPSAVRADLPATLDTVVARALSRDPGERHPTARAMAIALEGAGPVASSREIGDWVESIAPEILTKRARRVAEIESGSVSAPAPAGIASPRESADAQIPTGTNHVSEAVKPTTSPKARAAALLGVAAAVVAVTVMASIALRSGRSSSSATPTADPAASSPSSTAATPTPAPRTAPETDAAAPSNASSIEAPKSKRATVPHAAPASRPLDCKPPYTIDKDGNRHWKDGC